MNRIFTCLIILASLLKPGTAAAQDISGTWEGDMGGFEFLQVVIVQVNEKEICGYTWDYVYADRSDHCKANFTAYYDKKHREWVLTGTSFFENSGSHILMDIRLWESTDRNGKTILKGFEGQRFPINSLFGGPQRYDIVLEKKSDKPAMITDGMKDCMKEKQKKTDTVATTPPIVLNPRVKDSAAVISPKTDRNKIPAVTVIPPDNKINIKADSVSLQEHAAERRNKEQSRIQVSDKNLVLNVYDNATNDGDTVSIFYNDKLILSHQRLSEKPIVINITLDEKITEHKIVLYAENLGSIPPNTALVIAYAGGKRYELFSRASLDENAVLVFEYKPLP